MDGWEIMEIWMLEGERLRNRFTTINSHNSTSASFYHFENSISLTTFKCAKSQDIKN